MRLLAKPQYVEKSGLFGSNYINKTNMSLVNVSSGELLDIVNVYNSTIFFLFGVAGSYTMDEDKEKGEILYRYDFNGNNVKIDVKRKNSKYNVNVFINGDKSEEFEKRIISLLPKNILSNLESEVLEE